MRRNLSNRLDKIEKAIQAKYKLDQPLFFQYTDYVRNLLRLDLGPSFRHKNRSVNELILQTLPHSIVLGAFALLLALLIGIATGIISALRHNTIFDYGLMISSVIGISLPTFVIGPLLQLLIAIRLQWLPLAGYEGIQSIPHLILPALTLALPFTARISRLMRAGMLEVLSKNFILQN